MQDFIKRYFGSSENAEFDYFISSLLHRTASFNDKIRTLLEEARNGNVEASQELVVLCLPSIIEAAKKFEGNLEFYDKVQEGVLFVYEAINQYQTPNQQTFQSYCKYLLLRKFASIVYHQNSDLPVPSSKKRLARISRQTRLVHYLRKFKEPEVKDYMRILEVSQKLAEEMQELATQPPELTLSAAANCAYNEDWEEKLYGQLLVKYYQEYADLFLSNREMRVIELRFGFYDSGQHTLEEIGVIFGKTRERIRQIEAKAIRKIKNHFNSIGLVGLKYFLKIKIKKANNSN